MGKPKKISFDDSSMTKSKTKDNEEAIPSFATLPRKKKLRNNTKVNTPSTPTTSQVTWMKDVAQKGININRTLLYHYLPLLSFWIAWVKAIRRMKIKSY